MPKALHMRLLACGNQGAHSGVGWHRETSCKHVDEGASGVLNISYWNITSRSQVAEENILRSGIYTKQYRPRCMYEIRDGHISGSKERLDLSREVVAQLKVEFMQIGLSLQRLNQPREVARRQPRQALGPVALGSLPRRG